jgi:hypothetical protein
LQERAPFFSWVEEKVLIFQYSSSFEQNYAKEQQQWKNECCCFTNQLQLIRNNLRNVD